jgi:subtilase family serine protease
MIGHPLVRVAGAIALLASLAACGSSSSSPVAPVAPTPAPVPTVASGTSSGSIPYGASLVTGATYLGRASIKDMGVDAYVTMRDAAGLRQYAADASNPQSANYRHWLTPQQLGDRFGADATTYAAMVAALNAQHLAVKSYPQRQMVRIRGGQTDMERALGTTFGYYRKGTQTFVAPASEPHPLASLHIAALGNAVTYTRRHRNFVPVHATGAFIQGYAPQQIANAFDYTGAYNKGFRGDGIAIGIIGTGPITDGDSRIGVGDVADYRKLYGVSGTGSVVQIVDTSNVSPGTGQNGSSYSTGLATPPPVTSPSSSGCTSQGYQPGGSTDGLIYTTCNPEDVEAQLDTEQAATLAPNATINFYIAYNPMECNGPCGASGSLTAAPEIGLPESDDEIQQAIADNKSDIISMSFGSDELDNYGLYFGTGSNNFGTTELASLLAEGIAVFASSGDAGAEGCNGSQTQSIVDQACVSYPATDPSAVSVGGVNAPLDDSGRITGPLTGWGVQTQNADLGSGFGGSGGGCSIYFQAPTYETSVAKPLCGITRTQPDVSLDADTNTGVTVDTDADPTLGGRSLFAVGGTSVAAPEMAAMWALVLEACKNTSKCNSEGSGSNPYRLGNPNTLLFPILTSANAANYASAFYDVTFGNNALPASNGNGYDQGFTAGKGYDLVTGMGVPYASSLIKFIVGV